FKADYRKAFNGRCLVVVKAGKEKGMVRLTASSEGLADATITIKVK
ncbi:MAG TPA: hypothetical protein PKE28_01620, partial [Bacteroidales bacterium]|nr:hypothetical protein [Bacteroidales bacterium]